MSAMSNLIYSILDNSGCSVINFKTILNMKKIIFIVSFSLLFFLSPRDIYADDRVDEYINRMTLREKIGQILLVGFLGQTLSSQDIAHFKKINPGGVIFYSRNFEDARDIPPLISGIESIFKNNNLPMFFAIDQEGGV